MTNISFSITHDAFAFACLQKTETRCFWDPSFVKRFKPGTVFMGVTKGSRCGSAQLHLGRVESCRLERLGDMSEDSFMREGATLYWESREAYIEAIGGADKVAYVLRFSHLSPWTRVVCGDISAAIDTESRMNCIEFKNAYWLISAYLWPDAQKTVKEKIARELKARRIDVKDLPEWEVK